MSKYLVPVLAALTLLSSLFVPLSGAQAHGVRAYPAHGQMIAVTAVRSRTTVIIRHEVTAVQVMYYGYRGHRYALGSGPLWGHHLAYCQHRYRSYNPHTNLFLAYSGGHHHCRSPYIQ